MSAKLLIVYLFLPFQSTTNGEDYVNILLMRSVRIFCFILLHPIVSAVSANSKNKTPPDRRKSFPFVGRRNIMLFRLLYVFVEGFEKEAYITSYILDIVIILGEAENFGGKLIYIAHTCISVADQFFKL